MRKRSIKWQLTIFAAIIFSVVILSNIYILFVTTQIQTISNLRFSQERHLKALQDELQEYHATTLSFLSSKSSTALSKMLIDELSIRNKVQTPPEISTDQITLREREIYSLILHYQDLSANAVQAKRARNRPLYASEYEEMNRLLAYINAEIDTISLERFRQQLVSYETFISRSKTIHSWGLVLLVSSTLLTLVIYAMSLSKFLQPLDSLVLSSLQISGGNFDTPDIPSASWYEIDELINGFNRMKNDISLYIKELEWKRGVEQDFMKERLNNLKMQQLMKRMELYTMQAQMNPHFLFNTINTGVQLAIVEGADNTAEYMELLAKLFRHNLSVKDVIVPLKHEMNGIEAYCSILRIRFPKTLTIAIDVSEELQTECMVPVSILQPLVENSIIHGLKSAGGTGTVTIGAQKTGNVLSITVSDNGSGMSADIIEKLLRHNQSETNTSKVMGLENVIQRLYFFYPQNSDVISIKSRPDFDGTAICINIDMTEAPCIQF